MGVPPANQRDPVVVILSVAPGTAQDAQDLASWDTLNLGELGLDQVLRVSTCF